MKIFIIGGTGVLGRRVVKSLVNQNHDVLVLVRSEKKAKDTEKSGAKAIIGDLYNKELLIELTKDFDGILHLATAIPNKAKPDVADWDANNRLRTEAVKLLIEVVKTNKIKFYIQNTLLFSYGNRNGNWVNESDDLIRPMPSVYKLSEGERYILESAIEGEELINNEIKIGFPGIILRFGMFYSADSFTTIGLINQIKKRSFPIIGKGNSYANLIHVEDASQAVVEAVNHYKKLIGHTFNINDDQPVMYKELQNFVAEKLSVKPPRRVPAFLAKILAGSYTVNLVLSSYRSRNLKFKEMTGWDLKYPTYKEGFETVLENLS